MGKQSIFAPLKGWKYLFKKPVTIPMKDIFDEPRESQNNHRGFHVNDWEKCIGCGTCSEICPTKAISMVERSELPNKDGSKPERPVIDYGRCCFCGLCVDICTTGSLNLTKQYLYNSPDPDDYIYMPDEKGISGVEYELGYIKDETSDLLDLERKDMEHVGSDKRKGSFIEIVRGYSKEMAMKEASRCVECGICTKTCPANMNIPEYIKAIWEDDLESGLKLLYKTNPLPNVCGRICTHKCEGVCAISQRGEAIAIRWLKRYIVDSLGDEEYERVLLNDVSKKVDKKVAIVGGGASGLSCAYYLGTMGYEVHVYERNERVGGPMSYGAPIYRLPDEKLQKDLSVLERLGVNFHTSTNVGKDISLDELKKNNDAVFLAIGFSETRGLNIPGADNENVFLALDFLKNSRNYTRDEKDMPNIEDEVVVIGGGNVAFDVARSLVRLQNIKYGKSNVNLMALENRQQLPADIEEIEEGLEEGINFNLAWGPQKILVDEKTGKVEGVEASQCISLFDEEGRFSPKFNETTKIIKGKQVYLAIGQMPDYSFIPESVKEKLTFERGRIKTDNKRYALGVD